MSRVEQARTDIARRRALAEAATPGPWVVVEDRHRGYAEGAVEVSIWSRAAQTYVTEDVSVAPSGVERWRSNAAHLMAAADPAHVLAVLAAADATLDRHQRRALRSAPDEPYCSNCCQLTHDNDLVYAAWPCPDAAAVLDLYAPAVKR